VFGWLVVEGSNAITGEPLFEKKNYPVTIWYQRERLC